MPKPITDRVCESCGRWVDERETLFCVRMEVYAEPSFPDLDQLDDESREDARRQWDEQVERLGALSDDAFHEAVDEVHESIQFNLCPQCRRTLHQRVRLLKAHGGADA